jgi:hypothetical protein
MQQDSIGNRGLFFIAHMTIVMYIGCGYTLNISCYLE